ncbi:putative toxin-antitoxin system toxin component, PIN family [Ottowia sp.]|uniref:putative toxin-antitoxin system toxin component, PIN family n=1 Tax=Ottowia sp. TaxID=1898956 RepID=UPI003A8B6D4C
MIRHGSDQAGPPLPAVVIDTNVVLDVWVFDDPATTALRRALQAGSLRWLATEGMRVELARVLGYPQIARHLAPHGPSADGVLAAFDAHAAIVPAAAPCEVRCRDPDDQPFIDLAAAQRTTLVSKDTCVLGLAKRLAPLGVRVLRQWVGP